MHILIAIAGLIAAALVWAYRVRAAAEVSRDLADMAGDVVAAARRLGFRRKTNIHPVESVDDPALAIAAIGVAFLELSALPTAEQQHALARSITEQTGSTPTETQERMIVGRWLVSESGGPQQAVTRLARRLHKLDPASWQPLLAVLNDVGQAAGAPALTPRQRDALDEISRAMRIA